MTIEEIFKYFFNKLGRLDLELLIAHILKKSREFIW